MHNKIERGKSLSEQTYEVLCGRIRQMTPGNNRLPSEDDLAKEYGVSRATIREACNRLSAEGYLKKGVGRGMLVHPSAFAVKNRIDLISDFKKLLTQNFDKVDLQISHVDILKEGQLTAAHPWTNGPEDVFTMTWTYLGDGKKVIYGRFELPVSEFRRLPAKHFTVKDLPEFSKRYLHNPISYCAMRIKCGFHAEASRVFGIEECCPMQCWEETIFNVEDHPVGYSSLFLHPDEVVMSVLTKFH